MKKLLSLILAIALVLGCVGVISFVQATEEAGGVKLTYTSGGTASEQLFFYNVSEGVTVSGDTATLKVKVFNVNYAGRAWVDVNVVNNGTGATISATGTGPVEIAQDGSNEYTLTFAASEVTENLAIKLLVTALENLPAGTQFIVTSNANIYPNASKTNGGLWTHPTTVDAEIIPVSQVPGYVAPAPVEEKEIDVTFTSGSTDNHLYFYNVNEGITVAGDTATIKFAITNKTFTGRSWAAVTAINGGSSTTLTTTEFQEAVLGEKLEYTLTIPANEVHENLVIKVQITALETELIAANSVYNFTTNANILPNNEKQNNGLWTYGCAVTAVEADDEQPTPPTPTEPPVQQDPVGVKLNINVLPGEDNKVVHINNTTTVSDAMIENGVVTVKTTVYNTNNHDITVRMQLLNGWNTLASDPYGEEVIKANTKKTITATANLAEFTPASKDAINIRYLLMSGYEVGDQIYFATENADDGFYDVANWWLQQAGNTVETVTELPAISEPTPTAKPVATKIKYTANVDAEQSLFQVMSVNNAKVKVKFFNLGKEDVQMYMQLMNGWDMLNDNPHQFFAVPAGDSYEIELTTNLNDGAITKDKVAVRFGFKQAVKAGTEIIVQFVGAEEIAYDGTSLDGSGSWWAEHASSVEVTGISTLPEQVKRVPVGVEFVAKDDIDVNGTWLATNKGIITNKNIKDDVITKTFKIKNTGKKTFSVKFDLQATVKDDNNNDSWMSAVSNEFVEVAPGKTVELTCEVDVDGGGTVEIYNQDVPVSELFARFDFYDETGQSILEKDTRFVIYVDEEDISFIRSMITVMPEMWAINVIYDSSSAGTGDVLPVAVIATVALAFVALAVVSKKRKEN